MGIHVELVGLSGVGKTHLASRLTEGLDADVIHVRVQRPWFALACALRAGLRTIPLLLFVFSRGPASLKEYVELLRSCLFYAVQEDLARRRSSQAAVVLSDEGWFHKLRRLRRTSRKPFHYGDIPPATRSRIFTADVVVFVTADIETVCARRLQRKGVAVTPAALAQVRLELNFDPDQEEINTGRDLAQYHDDTGRAVVHIHNEGEPDLAALVRMIERGPQGSAAPSQPFQAPLSTRVGG